MNDKKLGALYGALLGDACGCPYEFNRPGDLPPYDQLDMIPPKDFARTWEKIAVGTYTDDGAQTLILLETLLSKKELVSTLRAKLIAWLGAGYKAVDNLTFDVGGQTRSALQFCHSEEDVIKKLSGEEKSGNGSLMRSIGVALVATSLEDAMRIGAKQSLATHPNARCQMTCALYCGIAYEMLKGREADEVIDMVFVTAYELFPEHLSEIDFISKSERNEVMGSGYVVDAFWSALHVLRIGQTFKDVIKQAIALGNDTDTTACIAGGLAGIKYGYDNLPKDWLDLLRGKDLIEPLAKQLC
jgi:ADP-ribosyl-[dinitrogen reductase] hydrolase